MPSPASTRRYFDRHARSSDRVYTRPSRFRAGPLRGRAHAAAVVARHPGARVLDAGCGTARAAEAVLAAGAASYTGIDLSPRTLELAHARVPQVELIEGDVMHLEGSYDVVLALGLFDYVDDPAGVLRKLRGLGTVLVASFTRADRVKAPLRAAWYRLHGCTVHDYTEDEVERLLRGAGYARVGVAFSGPRGFVVEAE